MFFKHTPSRKFATELAKEADRMIMAQQKQVALRAQAIAELRAAHPTLTREQAAQWIDGAQRSLERADCSW